MKTSKHRTVRRRLGVVAALVVCVLAWPLSSAAGVRTDAQNLTKLTISLGTPDPTMAQVYVAKWAGIFEKYGLDVTIRSGETAQVQSLVTGRSDIAQAGITTAFIAAQSNIRMKSLYQTHGGGVTVWTVGRPGVNSFRDCRRLGTFAKGSSTYAWAMYLKKKLNPNVDIIPFGSGPARLAALATGNVDCANGAPSGFTDLVTEGRAQFIVDLRKPATLPRNFPKNLSEVGMIAMESTIREKRAEMILFLRAVTEAAKWLTTNTPEQVVAMIRRDPDFSARDTTALVAGYRLTIPTLFPSGGYIPPSSWRPTLAWLSDGELINPSDQRFSYANIVDMSLYNTFVLGTRTVRSDKAHNTLEKIAAWKLGDRTQWRAIYRYNRALYTKLGVSQAKARTFRLPTRTLVKY